jgi:hypothetical protein
MANGSGLLHIDDPCRTSRAGVADRKIVDFKRPYVGLF